MDNAIIQLTISVLPMALMVNILVDIVKNAISNYPKWLMPLLCLLFSAGVAVAFFLLSEKTAEESLYQCFSIAGVSYFFYSIGGYDFLRKKFIKAVKKDDKQN